MQAQEHLSLLTLLPHRHLQLATQYQESTATCASEPQAPHFDILVETGGFPPHREWRPSAHYQPFIQECSCCSIKEQEPCFSNEWQSDTLKLPGGLPLKVQRDPALSIVPDSRRTPSPTPPLQRKKVVTKLPH
jgi:hypothetical protein